MSSDEVTALLNKIVATGTHFSAAEVSPEGLGRIEFLSDDIDTTELSVVRRWLENQPGITDIRMSLAPDRKASA